MSVKFIFSHGILVMYKEFFGTVQFSIDLAVGDTVQFQAYHNSGASRDTYESTGTNRFGGYKLIGA